MDLAERTRTFFFLPSSAPRLLNPSPEQLEKAKATSLPIRGTSTAMPEPTSTFDSRDYFGTHFRNSQFTIDKQLKEGKIAWRKEKVACSRVLSSVDKIMGIQIYGRSLEFFKETGSTWARTAPYDLIGSARSSPSVPPGVLESGGVREAIVEYGPHKVHERHDAIMLVGVSQAAQEQAYRDDNPGSTELPCLKIFYDHKNLRLGIDRYPESCAPRWTEEDPMKSLRVDRTSPMDVDIPEMASLGLSLPPLPDSPPSSLPPLPDSPPPPLPSSPVASGPTGFPPKMESDEIDWDLYAEDDDSWI